MAPYTTLDDFIDRATERLDPIEGVEHLPEGGDLDFLTGEDLQTIRAAGVLVPIVQRISGPTVLLTVRPKTMAKHPGQVAFPGGKVAPSDHDEVAAALREAEEEVGLNRAIPTLIGRGAPYLTGTGFRIVPVVAVVPGDFQPIPERYEVDEVFETPLPFLMDPSNHTRAVATWKGKRRPYYEMPYEGFRIWGVTAGIIRTLYLDLYGD